MCNIEKWLFHNVFPLRSEKEKSFVRRKNDFAAAATDLPLAKVFFAASVQLLLAVYSKSLVILALFISCILQQYDWSAMSVASVAASLLLILLYNRPPWRLNTLLSLSLKLQSDNCFSEQPSETAKPCNPQRRSDGATIAEDCYKL